MAGIILESGVVLVPLACAALYIIIASNMLLFIFATVAATVGFVAYRLRYHYSSGARGDLIVRPKDTGAGASSSSSSSSKAQTKKKNKDKKRAAAQQESDHSGGEFDEIVQDAQRHCDVDDEVVERSGALLATAVTPEKTKYDMELYGSALSYDHRCFYICGRPTWVLAADFDYWRIPFPSAAPSSKKADLGQADQITDTWRRVLLQYKAAGFNAVRIRFHWGFHSPSKGKYDFTGSRDVNRLLALCEELGVLVIACLGPYVGDDVQGGGYPFWLIQRDHIRLRHLRASGVKIWDDRFAAAEGEWYDQLISMLVGHEAMTKNARGRGCILMVQLENHLGVRGALELPLALQDETRLLARMARERVIRAPLVTNNLRWPGDFTSLAARAWAAAEKKLRAYHIIKGAYHPDISGFTVRDIVGSPVDVDAVARVTKGDNAPMAALELHKPTAGSFSSQVESAISQGLSSDHGKTAGALPAVAWGADGILMPARGNIELALTRASCASRVVVVSRTQPQHCSGMRSLDNSSDSVYQGQPFVWHYVADADDQSKGTATGTSVSGLEKRTTDWGSLPWKLLPTMADLETMDQINLMSWQRDLGTFAYQATDVGLNASHVLHRCQVRLKPQHLTASTIKLQLNVRHRCTVWVNGVNMSGHETFHEQSAEPGSLAACIESMRNAGAASGPDRWGGTATYDVTKAVNISAADDEDGALNEVIVIIESYGLGTQADGANDARAPRGLLAAYWHGFNLIGEDHDDSEIHDHSHDKRTEQLKIKWEICGVDVTQLQQPYGSSGFPDEATQAGWQATVEHPFAALGWSTRLNVNVNAGVQWWRWRLAPANANKDEPVYLVISGKVVAYVWVNGLLLSKHRASTSSSSVLLRGGLGGSGRSASSVADDVVVMMYGWADDADISNSTVAVELSLSDSRELEALEH
ncbi:hypothetical protein GGF38_000504 [Coemansia sp. RSA 25]|nr:hypothetical protein GGF38_000504 [Coemansia sp. RSA 25]